MTPIRTALCSFGMSGRLFHAPFIQAHPHFHLYGVVERTDRGAKEAYPDIVRYTDMESMLADPLIELVIVNTPNATHHPFAQAAIAAGKHVVVEKPFTVTVEEGEELIRQAKEKGVLLSVYHNRRYDSDFRTTKQVIEEGWLGDIVDVEFHFDRFRKQLSAKQHKETPGPGTGSFYDLGSHLIDHALDLFGMPVSVYADITTQRPGSQVDDRFDVMLYYADNKRVRLKGSYIAREPIPSFIVHGMNGSFLKVAADVQEADLLQGKLPDSKDWGTEKEEHQGMLHTEKDGELMRKKIPTLQGNYMLYYDQLSKSIRNGEPLPVTAEEGLNVVKIIQASIQSDIQKKVISIGE